MGQIKNIKLHIVTDIKDTLNQSYNNNNNSNNNNNNNNATTTMHLKYYLDGEGKRVYTLQQIDPSGKPTLSAHPARFSPDDKYSKYRILLKKRFGILFTQTPAPPV